MKKWLYSLLAIAIVWLVFPGLIEFIGTVFFFLIFLVILVVVVYWGWSRTVINTDGKQLVEKSHAVFDENGKMHTEYYYEYEDIEYDGSDDFEDYPNVENAKRALIDEEYENY
ncbi:hypothetical protein FOA39_09715 [Streptococcus cristatus]|jgi:membrane protein required for beta-lactamase induction|uniref:hypothetical protein n=1 Tax=Streptococcus cristatus TaxID=45634 RepID=UPI0016530BAD|nr:hypothetical protein [Streptococcus cristatus]MBC6978156.1 hypothetical protein [Streptococcus cristatus]